MKHIATLLFLVLLASSASAQITINESDYISAFGQQNTGTTYSTSNAQDIPKLQALVDASGASQTWNFNGPSYTVVTATGTATILTYPGGAPLASDPDFAGSTNVIKSVPTDPTQATTYEFIKADGTGLWILGASQDSLGIPSKLFSYTPPLQELKFPLTYQITWQSSSSFNISGLPPGSTVTTSIQAVADGYGTLITPPSTNNSAIRVKMQTSVAISFMSFSQTSKSYSFSWYTKSQYGASISADSNQKATSGDYSVPSNSFVLPANSAPDAALRLYLSQNPASNTETTLSYTLKDGGPVQVEMMDALGRNVRMLQDGDASPGENIIPIDPKSYAPGSYFIRVTGNGMSAIRKLIITR
jgi:hypothetical protein